MSGTTGILVTGCDVAGSAAAARLAKWHFVTQHDQPDPSARLYHTAGVHPHDAKKIASAELGVDNRALATLESLASLALCVAVGEAGLDYDRMFSPRAVQLAAFDAQCALAARLGKPLFAHVREADAGKPPLGAYADALEVLGRYAARGLPADRVVVHCFTAGAEELAALSAAGLHVGFTGCVKNRRRLSMSRRSISEVAWRRDPSIHPAQLRRDRQARDRHCRGAPSARPRASPLSPAAPRD